MKIIGTLGLYDLSSLCIHLGAMLAGYSLRNVHYALWTSGSGMGDFANPLVQSPIFYAVSFLTGTAWWFAIVWMVRSDSRRMLWLTGFASAEFIWLLYVAWKTAEEFMS